MFNAYFLRVFYMHIRASPMRVHLLNKDLFVKDSIGGRKNGYLLGNKQLYKDSIFLERLTYHTFKRSNKICTSWSHFQKK